MQIPYRLSTDGGYEDAVLANEVLIAQHERMELSKRVYPV
jgi:hypothetical protein